MIKYGNDKRYKKAVKRIAKKPIRVQPKTKLADLVELPCGSTVYKSNIIRSCRHLTVLKGGLYNKNRGVK
jgi:hypothetical protein